MVEAEACKCTKTNNSTDKRSQERKKKKKKEVKTETKASSGASHQKKKGVSKKGTTTKRKRGRYNYIYQRVNNVNLQRNPMRVGPNCENALNQTREVLFLFFFSAPYLLAMEKRKGRQLLSSNSTEQQEFARDSFEQ